MRLLTSVAAFLLPAAAFASGFSIVGAEPGSWPQIFSSVGFAPEPAVSAEVFIARPGTAASAHWRQKLESGAFLVVEGESPLAASFGFHPGKQTFQLGSMTDVHRPKLPIILEHALELTRFEVPAEARVFTRERWTGAPLIAGMRRGAGGILWVAVSPGQQGYERFPYLLHALTDLGLELPYRSSRLWAFFDYSYRTRVDLDYFAAQWRKAGIGALHVASWHFYEPDPERDAYMKRLIDACHREGILVYAWVELPHVSEKFWNDHPEWREKTAVLQDAHLDWRKLMNLENRKCFQEVSAGIQAMIRRLEWDGVNLAELYYESLEGAANPARFTPMNDDVRAEFRASAGFDPIEIYSTRKDSVSLRTFLDFRAELARKMQTEWMEQIEKCRSFRPDLDIVLTHVDDRFDTGMKDAIGADAGRVLPMLDKHDFTFLIEDPATVWNLGPQRYPEIARRYKPLTSRTDKLAVDINVVDRYQDVYPTKQQTGTELFQLVNVASKAFTRVALYFENSILAPDLPLLASSAAVVTKSERVGSKRVIDSPDGVGIPWTGPALVDSKPWPIQSDSVLWLPAGSHALERQAKKPPVRVIDFNGTLQSASSRGMHSVDLAYKSSSRAIAVFDHKPVRLDVDGAEARISQVGEKDRFALMLPRGQHLASVQTE